MTGSAGTSTPPRDIPVDERIRRALCLGAIFASGYNVLNTLSEKRMRQMSCAIRAKPDWVRNSHNAQTVEAWKAEAKAQALTDLEADYVFAELDYYASLHSSEATIFLGAVDGVWCSDSLVDDKTAKALKNYAVILENVLDKNKYQHPNTGHRVLDLIDPSLYPLMYQRSSVLSEPIASPLAALDLKSFGLFPATREEWSRAVNHSADSEVVDMRKRLYVADPGHHYASIIFRSETFCWLPTEFRIDDDGLATIESYINNLHPRKHAVLYPVIASVFSKMVPMLEQVVTDLVHPRSPRVVAYSSKWYTSEGPEPTDTWSDDFDERYEQWKEERVFVPPQPEPFVAPDRPKTPYSLRGRRLQAMVKMSNIELTPENPERGVDDWHVEIMANERTIATGVYYYDVENIAGGNVEFREKMDEDVDRDEDDWRGIGLVYGINEEDGDEYDGVPLSQAIGGIEIMDQRCVVFPDIYQRKFPSLRLADSTKSGHCKTLVFYFVDPSTRIPSTEIVPPQQQSWWAESALATSPLSKLPCLVKKGILDKVDFPISLDKAKKDRMELLSERHEANKYASDTLFTSAFFIEH
ncbi:hypothetical protein GGI18_003675 [Coemansia linderi]|uniref:Uncharacterized protein n=1 Tax=Coemansia linderi TaxID=2663919 RepID=A0ACC1KB35_9FUNG|nr:hypothetical protein GGI18_003675 [Coemansia linderi]